ncbi:hypothetical protein Tco_1069820 [Tanacetum coccineum]|uniref:Uncharacterized protein n=1 Tax=Tanacetum coccineum TaxID=301880 RepID=A0ABQ5HLU6_9ASTR
MSGTIPPILPPLGSTGDPNPNRVDTMPNDTINTTTTTNVAQNVVAENLPQLLDSTGGSHVTNIPEFDKEDFTSWKVRFLVFLNSLELYLLKTLEDGPCVPMSSLSTSDNPLPKQMWNDLILAHEGPSNTRDTKIAASRLKLNAFKSFEGEKRTNKSIKNDSLATLYDKYNYEEGLIDQIYEQETQRFTIQASSSKALISNNHFQDSDSDVEEDHRTNNEFMANLNVEYHERALLENQKRFYKRSGRVGSARKPIGKSKETCFTYGKPGHFQKVYPSNKTSTPSYPSLNNSFNKHKPYRPSFNQTSSQNTGNHQKDYKGKYKGLIAEMAILNKGLIADSFDWDKESVSLKDEGTTKIKAFMAIAEDEPSVGKADARFGQWVEITMKKVHRLLSMIDGDERKHVLDYTHVDLHYVEDQRKNLVNKFNLLKQEFSVHKSELCNIKITVSINCSLQNEVIRVNLENESLKDEISNLKRDTASDHTVRTYFEEVGILPEIVFEVREKFVLLLVKLHGVHVTAFSEDGLSAIATKLGTPLMLDSYTSDMCMYSWGSMSGNPVGVRVVRCLVTSRRNVPRIQAWPTANTSDIKKKGVEPTKEGAISSGSSLWNVETSNINSTPIVEKIGKLEQLIIDGKCTLFDDDGKPLKRVDYPGDHDSDDERDSYENGDYDEDPYDDDMYEGQDLPDKLQDTCDSLDIRVRGRRKK